MSTTRLCSQLFRLSVKIGLHLHCAQVFSVVKSTLEKLMLVGMIAVDPKVQAQELTQSVGEEITKMIAAQKELERRFEELVSAQHTLRNLPNKTKLRENQVTKPISCWTWKALGHYTQCMCISLLWQSF